VSRGQQVEVNSVKGDIEAIRHLVGWQPTEIRNSDAPSESGNPVPALHAVGYSMGGYLAQSVFFTWPFALSSCTTIGSGGPLRDVALTTFAHPEEWQSVMHALRFEISNSMLQRRLVRSRGDAGSYLIAGINEDHYAFFDRIFNDVFLQDSRGPYRQRLSEYAYRLLFVLGGRDPVISTQSVLESSPSAGINMIQVANLEHFPWSSEPEWREFWLPQVVDVVRAFSKHAEEILAKTLHDNWNLWPPRGGQSQRDCIGQQ
jgi:pimeloyl-ACP methyl ester carboxylesterase